MLPPKPERTWERWQWRDTLHSLKLQHYWNLIIRLFSVICMTLVGRGSYPSAESQSVYSIASTNRVSLARLFLPKAFYMTSTPLWPNPVTMQVFFFLNTMGMIYSTNIWNLSFFWLIQQILKAPRRCQNFYSTFGMSTKSKYHFSVYHLILICWMLCQISSTAGTYLPTLLLQQARYDTRSIFKLSKVDLNSKFFS